VLLSRGARGRITKALEAEGNWWIKISGKKRVGKKMRQILKRGKRRKEKD